MEKVIHDRNSARELWIVPDENELALAGADYFVRCAREAIATRGRFSVALSGGTTPRKLYELLASPKFRGQVDWRKTSVFWGDERAVPPDDPNSNYRMARETLLQFVPIPPSQVHRFRTELSPPDLVASDYAGQLRKYGHPFDLNLLGLGENGHTASLFPDVPMGVIAGASVIAPWVPSLNSYRYSVSVEVINASAHTVFLVSGKKKTAVLAQVLEDPSDLQRLPAQRVHPLHGEALWIIDRAAAAGLRRLGTRAAS